MNKHRPAGAKGCELPPGQFEAREFIRFGLGRFRNKRLAPDVPLSIVVGGDIRTPIEIGNRLSGLNRIEQVSDFHCVTSWSIHELAWSGVRFADFYRCLVVPEAQPDTGAELVVFRGRDGYRCAMLLEDLLADDILLADRLDGKPLDIAHGAPLRLVAPAHYGYKSVKYLCAIDFLTDRRKYRFPLPYPGLMDHPRARVAKEERARFLPNWLIRPFYRLFVPKEIR